MTSEMNASATSERELIDSELDAVSGGVASICGSSHGTLACPIFGGDVPLPLPPPPPPPPPTK